MERCRRKRGVRGGGGEEGGLSEGLPAKWMQGRKQG